MDKLRGQSGGSPRPLRVAGRSGQSGGSPRPLRVAGRSGQSVPIDFIAGLFIFLVLLAYFLILWDIFTVRYIDLIQKGNTDIAALTVSDQLVGFSGDPYNWTSSPLAANSIGLASTPGVLDWNRVLAFSSLPYANAKQLLGVDRDFLIKIETPDGARYATIGQEPVNATRAAEVTRVAILNGTIVNVRLQLYE